MPSSSFASSSSRPVTSIPAFRIAFLLIAVAALVRGVPVAANPQGGVVVPGSGEATITEEGKVMTVVQSTDRAILHWDRFENTASETIRFQQPDVTSVTLNRVVGVDPTLISGRLEANGQLFLINPSGIVFGPGSRVEVGSLVASTLQIDDTDFLEGRYQMVQDFTRELSSVVNQGLIRSANEGTVALIAPIVDNSGEIIALAGRVQLIADVRGSPKFGFGPTPPIFFPPDPGPIRVASGRPVRVPEIGLTPFLESVVNTSSAFPADQVVRLGDGTVFLRGSGGIVVNSGTIDASATSALPAGAIEVRGHRAVGLQSGSVMKATPNPEVPFLFPGSGKVKLESETSDIYSRRITTSPGGPARVEGDEVEISTGHEVLSDPAGPLRVKSRFVSSFAFDGFGRDTARVQVEAEHIQAITLGNGGIAIDAQGDLALDHVRAPRGVRISSTGSLLAGQGHGNISGQMVVVDPMSVPDVVHVFTIFDGVIDLVAEGSVGEVGNPIAVFSIQEQPLPAGNVVRVNVVAFVSPPVGAGVDLLDPLPEPRTPYRPPTDPTEAGPPGSGLTLGARDNILLPTLRTGLSRQDDASGEGTGGERDRPGSDADRDGSGRLAGDPADKESGGLIQVVSRSRGQRSDLVEDGASDPDTVASRRNGERDEDEEEE